MLEGSAHREGRVLALPLPIGCLGASRRDPRPLRGRSAAGARLSLVRRLPSQESSCCGPHDRRPSLRARIIQRGTDHVKRICSKDVHSVRCPFSVRSAAVSFRGTRPGLRGRVGATRGAKRTVRPCNRSEQGAGAPRWGPWGRGATGGRARASNMEPLGPFVQRLVLRPPSAGASGGRRPCGDCRTVHSRSTT